MLKKSEDKTSMTMFDSDGKSMDHSIENNQDNGQKTDNPLRKNLSVKNQFLEIGSLFVSKYIIKKNLGQGSFGITYLAVEEGSGNKVVIKEFFPRNLVSRNSETTKECTLISSTENSLNLYAKMKEIFEEEARILVKVNQKQHKNIVGFVSLERNINNTIYFLMNYSEGDDLKNWLKENKNLKQKDILKIIIPVLNGLEHIHKYGIYHKDIKPENIYLRENDEPMLIDFGASVTSAHFLTKSYAPIEQVNRLTKIYGPYTDLYSVGVILYTMVTNGDMPPTAEERSEAISKGERDPYQKLINKKNELSLKYDDYFLITIDTSLMLSYQNRYQSSQDFKYQLSGNAKRKKNIIIISSILFLMILGLISYIYFKATYGFINVIANMKNSSLIIDEIVVKKNNKGLYKTEVGKHNIEVFKQGFVSHKEKVEIKKNKNKIIKIDLIPDRLTIEVKTNDKIDANIYINNQLRSKAFTPIQIFYTEDKYMIQAKKDGYKDSKKKILTYKDFLRNKKILLSLQKIEGSIKFQNPVGAIVLINGQLVKHKNGIPMKTPFLIKKSPGSYSIKIRKNKRKYKILTKNIKVNDQEETLIDEALIRIKKKEKIIKKNKNILRTKFKKKDKDILKIPNIPTIVTIENIKISDSEVTYDDIVRFLNSVNLPYEMLKKYFRINLKRVSHYIKKEDINLTTNYYVLAGYENYPIVNISWFGAKAYTYWLSEMLSRKFRLPTIKEWKTIALKSFDLFYLNNRANYLENSSYSSIKTKDIDDYGLYDFFGNVSEWMEDKEGSYSRAIRGGSFKISKNIMHPSMNTLINENSNKNNDLGFRLIEESLKVK